VIKILIADDHAVVRKGVRHILSEFPDDVTASEAGDSYEVIDKIRKNDYDIVLLDIAMPGKDGLEALKEIKIEKPKLPVLILSMFPEEQFALRALKSGASGYLTKESIPEELLKAIKKILRGGKYVSESFSDELLLVIDRDVEKLPHETLSDREYQVMLMIAAGKTRKEIAEKLFLSVKTVSTYRTRILEKMGMKTNADLTNYMNKHNLIT
jgi:two-component system invasion response regulator UvrY